MGEGRRKTGGRIARMGFPVHKSKSYSSWNGMKQRCSNPSYPGYARYGARGITFCERWRTFDNFYTDMGERPPGMELDRVDNDGPYEPTNCRWATKTQQANNRRTNTFLNIGGSRKTVAEWSRLSGIQQDTILERLKRGWGIKRSVFSPLDPRGSRNAVPVFG